MTSKQRAYLKKIASSISPIFQVGKNEISQNMISQLNNALEARELIKLHVLDNSEYSAREAADIISNKTASEVVCVIGNKFVLFKRSEKSPKINIDGIR